MMECFHRSLKTALACSACLASSDWFLHLPLVLLRLWSVPKEDTGFSVFKAVLGSPLTVSGEFLESPELPPSTCLQKIKWVVSRFAVPPPHHVPLAQPVPLPQSLLTAKFVFVREDASVPPLSPLYRGPYLEWEWQTKFFCLQIGNQTDMVSVDKLKPFISNKPISPALPPLRGCLALNPVPVPSKTPLSAVDRAPVC